MIVQCLRSQIATSNKLHSNDETSFLINNRKGRQNEKKGNAQFGKN